MQRDSVLRRLAHVPLGWRATILHVRIRCYRWSGCGQVWRQDTTAAAASRAKLSTQAVMRAWKSVVIDRMSIARIAAGLGVSWHTVDDAVLATGHQLLIADLTRFDGVQVLDMVEGRCKQVLKTWPEAQTPAFRNGIEIVAMDGFTGFKTAAAEEIPDAVAVMDRFMLSPWPAIRWTDAANASSKKPVGTAAGSVIRSTASAECRAPVSAHRPPTRPTHQRIHRR